MAKVYTITRDGIMIGHFQNEDDRDKAFEYFVLPKSKNCFKSEIDG